MIFAVLAQICIFAAGMKNLVLKYASALLAVWYCLSIIGFDVHSCEATGDVFVNSILTGTSCDDIHPEDECCEHGTCCGNHGSSCCDDQQKDDDCCTNQIEVLDDVVVTNADEDEAAQFSETLSCMFVESNYDVLVFSESIEFSYEPDSGHVTLPDCQAVLNIWRI